MSSLCKFFFPIVRNNGKIERQICLELLIPIYMSRA